MIGGQITTDGVLARRLGFAFAHVEHGDHSAPLGMRRLGRRLSPLLFGSRSSVGD